MILSWRSWRFDLSTTHPGPQVSVYGAVSFVFLLLMGGSAIEGQEIKDVPSPDSNPAAFQSLPLEPARRSRLEEAIRVRDFHGAETFLLEETKLNPKSSQLLAVLGGIFFQDGQYLNAAIAIKRAEAISPLDDNARFTLAMAYIVLNHRDWARPELDKLLQSNARNPLYSYWLSRLDYDAKQYEAAIGRLQTVLKLDPSFVRAHDNLGLCYEALGNYEDAIHSYEEATRLNRLKRVNSPWSCLNLGALLVKLGKLEEAESYLKESLQYDSKSAQAHYQLGVLLEKQRKDDEAITQLTQASILDPSYPEPHYALGRIYQRQGDTQKTEAALNTFQKLKKEKREEQPH